MGEQVLQCLDLAPLAFLSRLHDTGLEPTHVLVDLLPVDGVPVDLRMGGRTSRKYCRHLPCLLGRFVKLSRGERPDGSLLAFARRDLAWERNPYPCHYSAAFASSTILYPQHHRSTFQRSYPEGSVTGLPCSADATLMP